MDTFLDGKVAVVTGGGRGLGAATAVAMAEAGADVAVTARTQSEIQETVQQVCAVGRQALAVPADVVDGSSVRAFVQQVLDELGRVDVLVNNAGVLSPVGDAWTVATGDWAYNIQVNLTGVFFMTHAVLPHMIERGSGRIINVTTGAARRVTRGWSAYGASKAGLEHFTRIVAAELQGTGVTLNAAAPGVVDTEMQAKIRGFDADQFPDVEHFRAYKREGVLRDPSEAAQIYLWLAHPATRYVNGEILHIDDPDVRRRMSADLGMPMLGGLG
jgi:NAD(P)-dependent dehydrogenase (short-subunit alcohol dehydrogenase family)